MTRTRVLVTGGSGFLGGHLALALRQDYDISFTYNTHPLRIEGCRSFRMDFHRPETVSSVLQDFVPHVVIHCAALPNAAQCEKNPDEAWLVNVQAVERLLNAMPGPETLFVYISTDLIFDGHHAPYSEEAIPQPTGVYGLTKYEGERISQGWSNHLIFRPALIFGPPSPSGKGSFVQWMDDTLKKGELLHLFIDEFRTPVYVMDICNALRIAIQTPTLHRLYNLGGPERIARIDYGRKLAVLRGYDPSLIHPVRLSDFHTGYARPADVSMNSLRIQADLGLRLTPVEEGLKEIFR